MKWCVLALVLGCAPLCDDSPGLRVYGEPDTGAQNILAAVEKRDEPFPCGDYLCSGATYPEWCNEVAIYVVKAGDAKESAEAHELCHAACGAVSETEANACAQEINRSVP